MHLLYVEVGNHVSTSLTGVTIGVDVTSTEKIWSSLQAIGDIAFAYSYATVLVEIQARQAQEINFLQQFCEEMSMIKLHGLHAGYTETKPAGEPCDEESYLRWSVDHHHILHAVWNFGICSIRKQSTRQLFNRIWIL